MIPSYLSFVEGISGLEFSYLLLLIPTVFFGYHLIFYIWNAFDFFSEKPQISYQSTPLNNQLIDLCSSLQKYRFPIWGHNTHCQTFYNSVVRRNIMPIYERERILSHVDGGTLCLDWISDPGVCKQGSTIIVVIPGICNSIDSHYVRSFTKDAANLGFRVVVAASRGVVELSTPKLFTFGGTEDIKQTLEHIKSKYPSVPIVGVGFSLGGNILCKYLGEVASKGEEQLVIGAVALGQGYDGSRGIETLKKNWLYDMAVSRKLTRLLKKNSHVFKDKVDVDHIIKHVSSVEDFDKLFTIKQEGLEDSETYYRSSSSIHFLPYMNIPLLLVNALDDPIVDRALVPHHLPSTNKNIILVTTEKGGHLSWSQGFFVPRGHWHEQLAIEFASALVKVGPNRGTISHTKNAHSELKKRKI